MVGSAPQLLFVHGYPLDHRLWEGQEARVFDLPGFGGRAPFEMPAEEVTVEHYAEAVRAEITARGDGPVVLVALSMGGYVAFECWRRFPEKIAGFILCDTRAEADASEARAGRLAGIARARSGDLGPMFTQMAAALVAPARRDDVAFQGRVLAMMHAAHPRGVEQALHAMLSRPDSRPDLPGITVPTLVLVGEDDALTPPAAARVMADGIPGARLTVIPDAGHLAPMERPDATNAAIRAFLEGSSKGS